MSEVIGKGVIEVSADSSKLKAGIDDAKRSIKSLGEANRDANTKASQSIDRYIKKLDDQNKTFGKSARETELYKLSIRGASKAQLEAADSALKLREKNERAAESTKQLRAGFIALAAAAGTAAGAAVFAVGRIADQIASYKGLSERVGDTAENIASLQLASDMSGVALDSVAQASIKLTATLAKTGDESKGVGKAIAALGLDFAKFKQLAPVEQLDAVAGAMAGFADGAEKTAVAVALFGKSGAELIPFLNDLAANGERQIKLTNEQIAAADAYTKAQAALKSEFKSFLQLAGAEAVPILSDVQGVLAQIAKDEASVEAATEAMKGAIRGALVVFQTIAVVGANVAFVFVGVGREIGAVAAQLNALARLDFDGFKAISNAVKEDGERARLELEKFERRVMGIGAPIENQASYSNEGRSHQQPAQKKPRLVTSGLASEDGESSKLADAKLAADLERIKKASEAVANAYSNAEKIMQARRAAGLVNEREYYESKLGFLRLNSDAQEAAIKQEIALLQSQKLSGKEKLDNDRKIADAQARLAKVRADAVANAEVLGVQEADAMRKVARSYEEAEQAAREYLNTINRQYQRELEGIGKGQQNRDKNAGLAQIEDRYAQQRLKLESDRRAGLFEGREDDYDRELDRINRFQAEAISSYEAYYDKLIAAQGDWTNGASEAIQNYYDNAQNIAKQTEDLFTNAFAGMEDALVNFVKTGKLDFKSLADSIIADLARIMIRQQLSGLIGGALGFISPTIGAAAAVGLPKFSGGGYTGNAPRTGGIDGKGGFLAVMHPRETVIDHTKPQQASANQQPVVVNQYFTVGDVATVSMVRQAVAGSEKRIASAMGRSMNYGGALA